MDVTELMGNEIVAYLSSGSLDCVARVDPRSSYRVNDSIVTVFDMANMHIFDDETDMAVT